MVAKKHLYLTALVALWGFSCQNQPVNESLATDQAATLLSPDTGGAFTNVSLNVKKVCNPALGQSCLREIQQIRLNLLNQNLIPVPQPGATTGVSVGEVTQRYKDFLAAHQGEPIASIFRQVYARLILNQYGVLESRNYELIKFYTAELTDENSMDFATLAKAASVLRGQLAADAYATLVNSTTERAREEEKLVQQRIGQLKLIARQRTTQNQETGDAIAAKIRLEHLTQSNLPSDLKQLSRLQQIMN